MNGNRTLTLASILLLIFGMSLPWVRLAPIAQRDENVQHLTAVFQADLLPQFAIDLLQNGGIQPNMTVDAFWEASQQWIYGENFKAFRQRTGIWEQNLFSFEYFILETSFIAKAVIVLIVGVLLLCVGCLGLTQHVRPQEVEDESLFFDSHDETHTKHSPVRLGRVLMILAIVTFALFSLELPYLDSLGYYSVWSMAVLDSLFDARVAFAPRVLIPIGLLLAIVAGSIND